VARRAHDIPYDAFEDAIRQMKERFPEAVRFQPNWYGRRIYIEVFFADGHGRVIPAHEE